MITLKTLPSATAQEVFDQVATHLLTQMKKSYDKHTDSCKYRYGDLKCAAGCLIADDEYSSVFEGYNWESSRFPDAHRRLIVELQDIHDDHPPETWESCLAALAVNNELEFKLDQYLNKPIDKQ